MRRAEDSKSSQLKGKAEDGDQRTEDRGQISAGSGQLAAGSNNTRPRQEASQLIADSSQLKGKAEVRRQMTDGSLEH